MPFINGRYYMNPAVGQAIEAAREAEAAHRALENRAQGGSDASDGPSANASSDAANNFWGDEADSAATHAQNGAGPVHRVEIEIAEVVPAHSGRAARGYVARVHRRSADAALPQSRGSRGEFKLRSAASGGNSDARANAAVGAAGAAGHGHSETHVFADHRDLLGFLRDALAESR